ncbi:homocysteine S-methyltransferase family protein [Butyricicoccus faecihominis]|uniref:homocysteine S-methyltransferase family protein n=1 Tax=Butyricicoccus faecihominis TaxID=1712515 RepID=UPI0024789427|nr:homocysteine S-methyltransferase family protein [Butyricicoccus faecihominis]MCQ5128304.1 homocysteine S-methyltransferase family protein [Butyricicoccus faecihominis]
MTFLEAMSKKRLFCDGGMGTILQERGLKAGELPETWNLSHPDAITAVHRAYLEAGSDIITTNTFGANALKYPDDLCQVVTAAVRCAQTARDKAARPDAYIALDLGPTGKLLKPMGDLDFEKAVALFSETARIGAEAGADLILIETMSDSYEAKAAVLGAKEGCDLPVLITLIFDEKGKLLTGGTVDSACAMLEGLRVDALGVNCGLGPKQMLPIVKRLREISSLPLIVNPNAGLPRSENGKTVFDVNPAEFADCMAELASLGVSIMGGCCGTTPEHIRHTVAACRDLPFTQPVKKHRTVVCSFSQAVEIGGAPVIIGERINPTGKSKFKEALRENRMEYILNEGLTQEDNGAHILDVNVGLPGIDEPAMMERVVTGLQSVTALPLQIDTSDYTAMERGMRLYNGKPMLNSVSGKRESMEAVLPLVRKYGGVVVGLALDESGIPDTAEGRVAIAKRIYETAEAYGISRDDIVIDALAMTISSDSGSALVTLETLRRIRDELQGHTILGVSNISFGLPQREIINANFYTMALQNGLSCAIINPNADAMMRSYRAFLALSDRDPQCAEYITAYGGQAAVEKAQPAGAPLPLGETIEKGLREHAAKATAELLQAMAPLEVVNTELIPALDRVGKGFEKGTVFLPQLLMSAEAAKAAFEVVKDAMKGEATEKKGKIILATVKGDIHDIGKNIVKVLLENYGYEVMDLGKDVPPESIVLAAEQNGVALVGLSALMTTTVVSMEATIRLLRERCPKTKIVVGGAVLTPEYAESIDADFYARDAMATVHCAQKVLG